MSNKKIVTQVIILTALFMFPGLLYSLKFLATQHSLTAYNQPSYYSQYNYRYNYAYSNYGYGYGTYNYRPYGPYLMPSTTCNSLLGCRTNYDSHIYIDNALDYTYYKNPWLLEPRYMDNHQWYARGLWPQRFSY